MAMKEKSGAPKGAGGRQGAEWARLMAVTARRQHICRVMGIPFGIVLPSDNIYLTGMNR